MKHWYTPKFIVAAALAVAFVGIVAFNEEEGGGGSAGSDLLAGYEYQPPLVKGYTVRKLAAPEPDGSTLEMTIAYRDDSTLPAMPPVLPVYARASDTPVLFYDDGTRGDGVAGDRIYAAHLAEDIPQFLAEVRAAETELAAGTVLEFDGHAGKATAWTAFDVSRFNDGYEVKLNPALVAPVKCGTSLLKQNSLFITDLSVVEDPARTYNVHAGTGNPRGAWTFGTLMKAAANPAATGVSVKAFLKSWVGHWVDDRVVNGEDVPKRKDVIQFFIRPWLLKCDPTIQDPGGACGGAIDTANWECKWDRASIIDADLLKYAPFKLTAIVNRIDLTGNLAYRFGVHDAGETRFIYTLIDPLTGLVPDAQGPPHIDRTPGAPQTPSLDWAGMNVILEYRNVQTDRCALRNFIQAWLDLSAHPLPANPAMPNTAYNDALEAITNTVTATDAMPGAPNGSALARIRTNERCFMATGQGAQGNLPLDDWNARDWEFRQFEIQKQTHLLWQTPLFNTPPTGASGMEFAEVGGIALSNSAMAVALSQWVGAYALQVAAGGHVLPSNFLAGRGRVTGEWMHYLELVWAKSNGMPLSPYPANFRALRQQYSLGTCQGCHNGETKTPFTHILVRGYGQPANYWRLAGINSSPDHFSGIIETGTAPKANIGKTPLPGGGMVDNLPLPIGTRTLPVVSAFLTGRNYGGLSGIANSYEDDETSNIPVSGLSYPNAILEQNNPDTAIFGLFFVNDPINSWVTLTGGTTSDPDQVYNDKLKNGYNDLERRKIFMCNLINSLCGPQIGIRGRASLVLSILKFTKHFPIPEGGH